MRLQHVSIPIPAGGQEEVRRFYGSVVGLREIPIPDSLIPLKVVWFAVGAGETELHFLPDLPADPAAERHFALIVDDLEECRERLASAGYAPYETIAIPNRPRFLCRDPFSNLIEFMTIEGDYLEAAAAS
jgi:catechol 2,3-dioxygenase-like lactoylglutathione lyase family enzyme